MSYHKLEEHEDHFVLHHMNGHEVKVAKKALSKGTLDKIQKFAKGGEVEAVSQDEADKFNQGFNSQTTKKPKPPVKMADGGMIDPTLQYQDEVNASYAPKQEPEQNLSMGEWIGKNAVGPLASAVSNSFGDAVGAYGKVASGVGNFVGDVVHGASGKQKEVAVSEAPAAQPSVVTTGGSQTGGPQNVSLGIGKAQPSIDYASLYPDMSPQYKQAAEQELAGVQGQAQVQQQLGEQQAKTYEKQAQEQEQIIQHFESEKKSLDADSQKLTQEYLNQHIDPRRLYRNMGVGDKIATTLGLIMGGIGGAVTGQGNSALHVLDKLVDQDIDAQKSELGKTDNLLSHNLRKYGNLIQAEQATRLQYATLHEAQLMKQASLAKGPMAKAQALQAAGQIRREKIIPMTEQIAVKQAGYKMLAQQPGGATSPQAAALQVRFLVPKEEQKEALKDLGELQELQKTHQNSLQAFDKVADMVGGGVFSPKQRAALVGPIVADISKRFAGRFTEQDAKLLESLYPHGIVSPETKKIAREQINKLFQSRMNSPTLQAYGIRLPMMSTAQSISTSPSYKQIGYRQ